MTIDPGRQITAETPWEFFPDDDLREAVPRAAEDQAMHVEFVRPGPYDPPDPVPVVHYLDDEEPEVPDVTAPSVNEDITPEVDALLIQQHYTTADEEPS